MNAIKMRWALYQTLDWLDNLEDRGGLNTLLESLPNGFGGRASLRELLSELPKPKHGYRVVLEAQRYGNHNAMGLGSRAFANLDCAWQVVEYDEKGQAMVHVFSNKDISRDLNVSTKVWTWDKMGKEEIAQWA